MAEEYASKSYTEIPILALRHSTRNLLSQCLNGPKVIPSPTNLPRDWRGLAHLAGVTCPHVNCPDPTANILSAWEKKEDATVQTLLDYLKELDRWDVIDDISQLLDKEVTVYLKSLEVKHQIQIQNTDIDNNILTIDDIQCIEACGKPKYYDAFLLYDDSDREFAMTILQKLENEYGLMLCCKDRDLVGGLPFEHEAIMQLIRDRCRRLIVVVSPLFLESSANKFLLTFAQALGIEHRQRKIIPCVYSKFRYPPQLSYYFVLDFTRSSPLMNFWDRLSQSIRAASPSPRALPPPSSPIPIVEEPGGNTSSLSSLPVEKWECKKVPEISIVPPAPLHECGPSSVAASSKIPEPSPAPSPISLNSSTQSSKVDSNSSTLESLSGYSESEPIIHSQTSSTASLISKVFTSKRIKPKWLFKKKKKVPIAIES